MRASRRHEQLTLALIAHSLSSARLSVRPPRPVRTSRQRSASSANPTLCTRAPRTRKTPSRDSRGRFVAFPTINAPSWYVFCCDGYRIPADLPAESNAPVMTATTNRPAPAKRKPRKRWLGITRGDVEMVGISLLVLIVSAWYRLHLVVPHR